MSGLFPIIRRPRRPLLPPEETPAVVKPGVAVPPVELQEASRPEPRKAEQRRRHET